LFVFFYGGWARSSQAYIYGGWARSSQAYYMLCLIFYLTQDVVG